MGAEGAVAVSNLPDGCRDADPRAPWNAPEPWEGRRCGECSSCLPLELGNGARSLACVADTGLLVEVDGDEWACEWFTE